MTTIRFIPKRQVNNLLNKKKQFSIMQRDSNVNTKVIKMQNTMLPKEIQELMKVFLDAESPVALMKSLTEKVKQIKGFEKISLTSFKFDDFKVDSLLTTFADQIAENIKIAKGLKLKTVPELVKNIKNSFGESLLVTKVEGLKNSVLVPASELEGLSNKAKKVITEDMEKLTKNGYVLPDLKYKENILVDKKTGDAMLVNLASLRKSRSFSEANDFMNSIKRL